MLTRSSFSSALLVVAVLAVACVSPSSVVEAPGPPTGRQSAEPLPLDAWRRATLHCDEGACERWHRIVLTEPGALKIEVHATSGADMPDFDVRLEDPTGEVLWGFAPTGHTPREIERVLGAGDYYLIVESVGELRGKIDYEAFAKVEVTGPIFRARDSAEKPRRPRRMPRRPEVWMEAEILQVEGRAGLPDLVVLDGGTRDEWAVGHRGELLEDGHVIATFVLIEVDASRSRGRFEGVPVDTITFETRARVRVPLE